MILEPEVTSLNAEEIHALIRQYSSFIMVRHHNIIIYHHRFLGRYDEELAKLRASQRPGRPIPRRVDEILQVQHGEMQEYEHAGFQMPDLSRTEAVAILRQWDGTRESMDRLKLVRIKKTA